MNKTMVTTFKQMAKSLARLFSLSYNVDCIGNPTILTPKQAQGLLVSRRTAPLQFFGGSETANTPIKRVSC